MRIAYLINQYPKISHSFIRREILALERRGFDITRIALRGWDGELVDKQDQSERDQTHYVLQNGSPALVFALLRTFLTRPVRLVRGFARAWQMSRQAERPFPIHLVYLAEACRIAFWLRRAEIKHVHAHFGTNSAEVAMLVHQLGGPSWSFTVHGPEEFDKSQQIGLAEKIRCCSFVVAVSSFGRSQLFRNVGHEHWHKVKVVHCGIERAFHADASSIMMSERRLICVGRLTEQKGQLLLIEAARLLLKRGTEFELVLAGDGEMRSEIDALIMKYKLDKRIRVTGWISGEQVRDEIIAARALVLPSFAEGLPVVIMEAMALKRPVISTFVAGIPELVVPGQHGWLIPAGDVDALAESMQACLDAHPETIARMGILANERILRRHDVDREALALIRLFQAHVA
jgi:colanic acid/amylovoran biosynthesis glycosyltransferase